MSETAARFNFNPSSVSSGFQTFPKGEYEFTVGTPKTFNRKNRAGNDSFGIRYPLTIASGEYMGKRTSYSCYLQSEGAQAVAKGFVMACNGYKRSDEAMFNEDFEQYDWGVTPGDDSSIGEAWTSCEGKRVIGTLDVRMGDNDSEQQDFKGFRPL